MLDQFEALLTKYKVSVSAGSRLEDALLFARVVRDVGRGDLPVPLDDDRPRWREMHGIFDLAQRLVWAERRHPYKFGALVPWLKLFASSKGQLAQVAPTAPGDQDSDKVFELLVAVCLLPRIGRVEPDRGSGSNPDLLFRFHYKLWGIACKRLYSMKPAAFRDTVTKAISQIEKSPAERGLVFVNLVNVLDHDAFLVTNDDHTITAMGSSTMAQLLDQEKKRLTDATLGRSDRDLADAFTGSKAMPGVVHYMATTYMTGNAEAPVRMTVQHAWSRGRVNELAALFQAGLNSTSSEARSVVRRRR